MSKEHQKRSDVAAVTSFSTSRSGNVEDFIAISEKIFRFPSRHGAPTSSAVDIDGKHESTSPSPLLTPADEERFAEKKEALKWMRINNKQVKIKQVTTDRATKVAQTSATSTQPSQTILSSKPVILMGKGHRLCAESGEIPSFAEAITAAYLTRLRSRVHLFSVR